ncbi:uncharacterized protein LOC100574388 [Acyrthosiphon pisum]|nr:uncharacterized protein LOC100574388 [Acyrthosiphon pisum]|eukprot:XP_008180328.1 PREDICTED: uncharacterized protein LOC100574388 [Acyrthosiphon pisum]
MARNIFNFLKSSSKRHCELEQFQTFLNLDPHRMLHPSQTRWLSLTAVVNRILEQWEALKLYFTDTYLSQRLVSSEHIYNALNDPFMKLYYQFLEWALPKFTRFNQYFQTQGVVITDLHEMIVVLYKDILLCFLKRNYVMQTNLVNINPMNGQYQLVDNELYLGSKVMLNKDNDNIICNNIRRKEFFEKCRQFLQTASLELKKRYNMEDPILMQLSALKQKNALSLEFRQNTPSLINLMKFLPCIVDINDSKVQQIDDQWRKLPISATLIPEDIEFEVQIDIFWWKIMNHSSEFTELCDFVLAVLSLPHANADCERIFSSINGLKTKIRSKLITHTVSGVLHTKQCITSGRESNQNCTNFEPTSDMLSRMTSKSLYIKTNEEKETETSDDTTQETIELVIC